MLLSYFPFRAHLYSTEINRIWVTVPGDQNHFIIHDGGKWWKAWTLSSHLFFHVSSQSMEPLNNYKARGHLTQVWGSEYLNTLTYRTCTTYMGTPCHFECWYPDIPPCAVSLLVQRGWQQGVPDIRGQLFHDRSLFIRLCPFLLCKHSQQICCKVWQRLLNDYIPRFIDGRL